ncbi:uncharacterized protein LOC105179561 [Sesamum indicum]|uniref:Uncharacterized protein LOC105179561 n=1 Tax=Sesamum indicum TaxID=4182 RepID=A0A6I9ULW5_SESIN|nr:uncharacterized protein LOC105179561 [Sesamum indicum]
MTHPLLHSRSFSRRLRHPKPVNLLRLRHNSRNRSTVRHQLLVKEPVPSINKAYSIIQSVEKQKRVQIKITEVQSITLHIMQETRPERKKIGTDKRSLYCTHCQRIGHNQSTCFKLYGTPDLYKQLTNKKKKEGSGNRGFAVQVINEKGNLAQTSTKEELLQDLLALMRNTMQPPAQGNLAHIDDFAGINQVLNVSEHTSLSSWIKDTGATKHICGSTCTLDNLFPLTHPTFVHLPDGTSIDLNVIRRFVHTTCSVLLNSDSVLWHKRLGHPSLIEPKTYLQACKDANWVDAMNQELVALAANKTWTLTPLPPGKRPIESRWVTN